jgi:DNA-binding NarL/FixJ family response regulator
MECIRLLVVDDHPVVRQGLRAALTAVGGIEVVGEAGNASSALQAAQEYRPDVILLDMQMPGSSGGVVVKRLKEVCPQARILVFTTFKEEEYLFGALQAGADGYLLKNTPVERLAAAIRSVHHGDRLVSPELMSKLIGRFQEISVEQGRRDEDISDSDRRVLELLSTGASNKQIAEILFTSDSTVKRKVQDLCAKFEVEDRVQLVVQAINRGLI